MRGRDEIIRIRTIPLALASRARRWSHGAMGSRTYRDRADAGRVLAEELADGDHGPEPVVLGLPRGGVPVAAPIAERWVDISTS